MIIPEYVQIACRKDCEKEKRFYFMRSADGLPMPQFCDDADGGAECAKCADAALKLHAKQVAPKPRYKEP